MNSFDVNYDLNDVIKDLECDEMINLLINT